MRSTRLACLACACVAIVASGCGRPTPSLATPSLPPTTAAPSGSPNAAASIAPNHSPGLDGRSNTIAFGGRIGPPVVQPDGTLLFDGDIFTVGVDGSNWQRLTTSGGGKGTFSWSPDGRRIVFRWDPSGTNWNDSDIAIVTLADLTVTTLRHHAWSPAWSPLGDWIAYYSAAAAGFGLYLIHPDGSGNHQILAGDAEYPTWSPDGRRLAFMSLGQPPPGTSPSSADYELYVVDVDGRNVQRLTHQAGEDGWPAWSHDGTQIAYARSPQEGESEIHVMSADGQNDHVVTDATDELFEYSPNWSPSDRYVAYHAYTVDESPTIVSGIFAIRPDGSGRLLLRPDGFEPAWQPVP